MINNYNLHAWIKGYNISKITITGQEGSTQLWLWSISSHTYIKILKTLQICLHENIKFFKRSHDI